MEKEIKRVEKTNTIELFGAELNVYGDGVTDAVYLMAKEVADWIEYNSFKDKEKTRRDVHAMLKSVDKKFITKFLVECEGKEIPLTYRNKTRARNYQEMLFITEFGLYDLLCSSSAPKAKKFKSEVFDIIQEIRKENRELLFSENSRKKNKEIKERQTIVENNKFLIKLKNTLEKIYILDNRRSYKLLQFINTFELDISLFDLYNEMVNLNFINKDLEIQPLGSRIPILVWEYDNEDETDILKITLPGMILLYTYMNFNNNTELTDDEIDFIYGRINFDKYFDNVKKKDRKEHKKNKKKYKKTIKAVDYIDYLEEKEKHKDKIRHVKVRHIK